MKNRLVFATGNPNKVKEISQVIGDYMEIVSLKEIGCEEELPETNPTIEANAIQKAQYVVDHYKVDCFSEDTGLEIESLNGEPGVYSARYAGTEKNADANMNLVLQKLGDHTNRKAQFRTVIALIRNGDIKTFEGIVKGKIAFDKTGKDGFGYDPIFVPDGFDKSFAEMSAAEKNSISHRARAVAKLQKYLETSI